MNKELGQKRDELCHEYMHSYKGTSSENNQDAFSAFMSGWRSCHDIMSAEIERLNNYVIGGYEEMLAEQKAEIERLREALSYLSKVPTQPYEKELAKENIELKVRLETQTHNMNVLNSEWERMRRKLEVAKEALDACMLADNERGAVSGIARRGLKEIE